MSVPIVHTTIDSITEELVAARRKRQKHAARIARRHFIEHLFVEESKPMVGLPLTAQTRAEIDYCLLECIAASRMWCNAYCEEVPQIKEDRGTTSLVWPEVMR